MSMKLKMVDYRINADLNNQDLSRLLKDLYDEL